MEAQLQAMEKTIETSELLEVIVETEAQTGVSGMMSVAGGGKGGLFVKEVLKDSPAAKALRLKEGDQLLSARVYFEDIKYEDALQILQCVEPYKVSFWLKRTVPGVDITRKPGTATFEVKGPRAKLAKLNIRSLRPLQKKKKKKKKKVAKEPPREARARGSGDLELVPLDVEFSLPKFSRLRKAKSAGEVVEAEPSPDLSLRPSSLKTKRRKLRFPRLKVKEVAAARAEGRLEAGLPKAAVGARGEAEGKAPRFSVPFPKSKKPRREPKAEAGFQAPQVEVDLPLPKARPGAESPKAAAQGEGFRLQAPALGLPKVEAVLPKVSAVGLEGPGGGPQAGLKLPTAEVVAPKVDVDLSLPKWEGLAAAPKVSLKGEGFRIKVPTLGVSAAEAEAKLPRVKSPALEVALGKGSGKAEEGLEEASRLGGAMPALEVEAPPLALELPLPKGKADTELPRPRLEIPDVAVKVPTIGLPKLGAARHEEPEGRLPQVELGVGKPESPKAKGPRIQGPGLGLSLLDGKGLESKAAAAAAAGRRVPALDVSVPRAAAAVELAAPALPGAKADEAAAEGPGFKLHVPQVALPKFDLVAKSAPLPPPAQRAREPKPEVDVPKLDLSLPAVKLPAVHLTKAQLPRPELGVAVERPAVEAAVPSPRLSFPSAALEMALPRVGVELGLPKAEEGRRVDSGHEAKLKMPTLETLGQELELSAPTCRVEQPGLEPSGGLLQGLEVSGVAAKIPTVGLALGKEAAAGAEGGEGKPVPTAGLEVGRSSTKLPAVEIAAAVARPGVAAETEAKLKSPKFALPKFSLSGPRLRREGAEAPETAGRGAKLRMPKFGISFPKSRWGVEAEGPGAEPGLGGRTAKGGAAAADKDVSERGLKLPSVELSAAGGPGLPEGRAEEEEGGAGISLPEVDLKVPKVSLPTFGGKGKEDEQELQAGGVKLRGSREGLAAEPPKGPPAKGAKFKMPSVSITHRDGGEAPGLDAGAKKPKGPSGKLSPPEAERGKLYLQAPGLPGRAPQVELPTFGTREGAAAVVGMESPGLQLKMPLLDIAVPGAKDGEEDMSEADRRGHDGELKKTPRLPSLGVSAPKVELDISLPAVAPEVSMPPGAVGAAEAKIRVPKVELPKFGKGEEEEGGSEAEVQLLGGRRSSLGREGRNQAEGVAEGSLLLGAKIRVPRVDLSLPKARLSDVELPLTAGEVAAAAAEGPEPGQFKMPSVGLPKFSAPKVKAPELELDMSLEAGRGTVGGPAKCGGSGSDGEGEAERELARVPQLELKAPKLRGSPPETLLGGTGGREAKSRGVPSLAAAGFGLGKAEAEARAAGAEDGGSSSSSSKFKLKMPSLSLSKGGTESGMDTQPLCPAAEGGAADFSLKMSQIALPDVGFSVEQGGKREAKGGGGGSPPAGLEIDLGGIEAVLRAPQIKMPTFGGPGSPKGDSGGGGGTTPAQGRRGSGGGDLEGLTAACRVPGVELSAPSLRAHAEYEVEGAQLRHGAPPQLEGADKRGRAGSGGQKSPGGGKAEEAGRKYQVKLPRFGLSTPKAGLEARAGALGGQQEAKGKGPIFGLARPKGKGAEGSAGLLEGDEEGGSKGGLMAKLKLGPSFGLSLSKPKAGAAAAAAAVNGELEPAAGGPSKLKVPEVGFSTTEEAAQHHEGASSSLQNGAQDGKTKLGKIRLPQVELSSPSKLSETDPELNLNLVRAEEAKEEGGGGGGGSTGPFSSLKAPKFRAPKITFSGLKKRNGEAAPPSSTVGGSSVAVRTEAAASLETGDGAAKGGEKASRFRFPKLVLSPKSPHGTLEITSERRHDGLWEGEGGLKIKLPSVGFSEEQSLAAGGAPGRAVGKGEGEATAAAMV